MSDFFASESWIRREIRATRQPEGPIPAGDYDRARSAADLRDYALFRRVLIISTSDQHEAI